MRNLPRPLVLVSMLALIGLLVAAGIATARVDPATGPLEVIPVPPASAEGAAPSIGDFAETGGGKVLVAITSPSHGKGDFLAARVGPDGNLDRGFGEEGFTAPLPHPWGANAQAIAKAPGGGSVLVGYRRAPDRAPVPLLAEFSGSGALDRHFGGAGWLEPKPPSLGTKSIALHDVVVTGDGTILAVGATGERAAGVSGPDRGPHPPSGIVLAYRPDGRLDKSFGHAGRVLFPSTAASAGSRGYTGLTSIALEPGGKILVTGFQRSLLFVARLLPDGSADPSFGGGSGNLVIDVDPNRADCYGNCPSAAPLALLPDGRILVLSARYGQSVALARLLPDGKPDVGFGPDGVRRLKSSGSFLPYAMAVGGGRIVLAGWELYVTREAEFAYAVHRYRLDGKVDRAFGRGGLDQRRIKDAASAFAALARPDGSVWVGGSQSGESPNALLLGRYPAP